MKTNDLKKGARVQLRNGWYATIADNARGNTRMAAVEGFHTETGSVYSHDIVAVRVGSFDGKPQESERWEPIEHTPAQKKLQSLVS